MSKFSKLISNPSLFFKDAMDKRSQRDSGKTPTFLIGFRPWKDYMSRAFPDRLMIFIPKDISENGFSSTWAKKILAAISPEIFVWGFKVPVHIADFAKKNGIKIV